MDQPGAVIESDLLDLTGLTLEDVRACRREGEWHALEQRLMGEFGDPCVFSDGKPPRLPTAM